MITTLNLNASAAARIICKSMGMSYQSFLKEISESHWEEHNSLVFTYENTCRGYTVRGGKLNFASLLHSTHKLYKSPLWTAWQDIQEEDIGWPMVYVAGGVPFLVSMAERPHMPSGGVPRRTVMFAPMPDRPLYLQLELLKDTLASEYQGE